MKIAQISTFPPYLLGGQEAVVYHLSKELGKNGHEVTVITSTTDSKVKVRFYDKFHTAYIPSLEFKHRIVIPKNLRAILYLIQDADIIHIHSPDVSFAFEIGLLSKIQRKPIVTSVLSYFDSFKHPFLPMRVLAFPIEGSVGILAKMSEAVHVKNIGDYAKISRLCDSVAYIPDGIPQYYFKIPPDAELIRREIRLSDEKVILYVGRIHKLKGPHVLIQAMKHVVEAESKAVAILVGPSNTKYRTWLEELVRELGLEKNIIFAGILTEKKKISAYDAADVVVVPSCSDVVEAYSLVASEGWARGKPVVASAVGALKYRVQSGVNGFLVKPNEPRELAEKILESFDMKVKKIPQDVWSWNRVTKKFEELYKNIAA